MRFAEYPWTERKLYWLNEGGSHSFAAAPFQACRLNFCSLGQIESLPCKHADGFSFMSAMAPVCYSCEMNG
uniref:DUF6685 family protein n=1 Tax=Escherichia coli TaxID=562 RepID=UPI0027D3098F|nr:DUF6685 family protein [Escherichia coli]